MDFLYISSSFDVKILALELCYFSLLFMFGYLEYELVKLTRVSLHFLTLFFLFNFSLFFIGPFGSFFFFFYPGFMSQVAGWSNYPSGLVFFPQFFYNCFFSISSFAFNYLPLSFVIFFYFSYCFVILRVGWSR